MKKSSLTMNATTTIANAKEACRGLSSSNSSGSSSQSSHSSNSSSSRSSADPMALFHPPIIHDTNNKNKKKIVPSTTETTTVATNHTESSSSYDRGLLFTLEDSTTWTNTRLVITTSTTTTTRRRWRILAASDRASAAALPFVPKKEEGTDSSSDTNSSNCTTLHSNNDYIRTQLQRQLQPVRQKRRRWVSLTRCRIPQTTSTRSTLFSQQQQHPDLHHSSNSSSWPVLVPIVSSPKCHRRLSTFDGFSPLLPHQSHQRKSYVALSTRISSHKIMTDDRNGMVQQPQQLPHSIDLDLSALQSYLHRMSFIHATNQLKNTGKRGILRLASNNNVTNIQAGISPGLYFLHHDSTPHENFLWDCIERISFVLQNLDNNNDTSSSWPAPSTFSLKRTRWDTPIVAQEKDDTTIVLFRLQGHTLLGDMFLVLERPNLAIKSYINALWIATNNSSCHRYGSYPSDDHGTAIQVIADNDDDDDECAVRQSNNNHITNQRMINPIALTLHRLAKAYLAAGRYLDALQVAEKSIRLYQRNIIIINNNRNNNNNKLTGNNNNTPPSTTLYDDIQRIRMVATNCLGQKMTRCKRRFTQARLALIQEEDDEQDL